MGGIVTNCPIKRGILNIGRNRSVGLHEFSKATLTIKKGGSLKLMGYANFSEGTSIRVDEGGELIIGDHFYCNKNCHIGANKKVEFGDNCLLGSNISIQDCDGHHIYDTDGNIKPNQKNIKIGDHVWIASDVIIQKGTYIERDNVVSRGSIVYGSFTESNYIIGGFPIGYIKKIGGWKN